MALASWTLKGSAGPCGFVGNGTTGLTRDGLGLGQNYPVTRKILHSSRPALQLRLVMVSRPASGMTVGLTVRLRAPLLQTSSNSALAREFRCMRPLLTKNGCWVCTAYPSRRNFINSSPCGTGFSRSICRLRRKTPLLGSGMTPKYTQLPPLINANLLAPSPPCTSTSFGLPGLSPSATSSCGCGCEVGSSPTTIWRQEEFLTLKNATSATSRMRPLYTLFSNAPLPEPFGFLLLLIWQPPPYLLRPSKQPPSLLGGTTWPAAWARRLKVQSYTPRGTFGRKGIEGSLITRFYMSLLSYSLSNKTFCNRLSPFIGSRMLRTARNRNRIDVIFFPFMVGDTLKPGL